MCTALAFSVSANAQEEKSYAENEIVTRDARINPDPILSSEGESTPNKNVITAASTKETQPDSLIRPVKPAIKVSEKIQEEDPLSFNFLYYIIEKFKLSDIIE